MCKYFYSNLLRQPENLHKNLLKQAKHTPHL